MPENIQTSSVACVGGLNTELNNLLIQPGEAITMINYEPALTGGYRRINGYSKFDTNEVPPTSSAVPILGVAVYDNGVIAAKVNGSANTDIYFSTGSGWGAKLNSDTRPGSGKHRFVRYNWTGIERIIGVDGLNDPFRYEGFATDTYTLLDASGTPADPKYIAEFQNHIFYGGYSSNTGAITFTVPLDETSYAAIDGAGEIVVGDTIVNLRRFREQLIIFCETSIWKLVGTSKFNWELSPITYNIGLAAADTVQEIGGDLYFLAADGVRTLSATERIGDVELAVVTRKIHSLIPNIFPITQDNISTVLIRNKNQYRLFYSPTSLAATQSKGLLGGIRAVDGAPTWEWGELRGIKPFTLDNGFISNIETIIHGGFDGFVYQQENGTDLNGTSIESVLQLAYNNLEDPTIRKTLYKVTIFHTTEGSINISVPLLYDFQEPDKLQPAAFTMDSASGLSVYGTAVYGTALYGTGSLPAHKELVIGSGFQSSFKFITKDSNPPHTIQGYALEYGLGSRH